MASSICLERNTSNFEDEPIEDRCYHFLDAFQELHGEVMKMQCQVNRLKSEKRDLDKRIENLVNENDYLKTELETMMKSSRQAESENKIKV